jgi:hypothetical protein
MILKTNEPKYSSTLTTEGVDTQAVDHGRPGAQDLDALMFVVFPLN